MKMIGQRERFGSHLGLERIQLVLSILDNPQAKLKFVHVAGTNGKGSVTAMLGKVLVENGYRVGTFTSPHLEHYAERFQVNGQRIDEHSLSAVLSQAEQACLKAERLQPDLGPVTEFELATAAAFLYFLREEVDLVVLETGLGGRLDSTNIVQPELTIITTVGFDHQERLGLTLTEIAWEKGGIIKQGVPIISGVKNLEAERVLQNIAQTKEAPWFSTKDLAWQSQGWDLSGGRLIFPEWGSIEIGLLGEHQLENAATALLALRELQTLGWSLSSTKIREGMKLARWSGRFELISQEPFIILDGSHNQQGINSLVCNLKQLQAQLHGAKFTFLFGMLDNKDLSLMDPLLPLAERFVFTDGYSGRLVPMNPEKLVTYVQNKGYSAVAYDEVSQALADAKLTAPLCICGSLYLVGAIKRFL